MLLHQDNAPAHTARLTQEFLNQNRVRQLRHPPYSPDLAPCDFLVLPQVKRLLKEFDLSHLSSPESPWRPSGITWGT